MSKTVLITGASRGIGRACAEAFARDGWRVGVGYNHSRKEALSLIAEFAKTGVMAVAVNGDVADEAAVSRIVAEVESQLGPISVLVNNAGVACDALLTDTTGEMWSRTFEVNVRGAFNAAKAVLPGMISRREGCIINVSSVWGVMGGACEAAYSASKAALIGLTKSLAREVGPSGVRVNCVAPGVIETDMLSRLDTIDREALAAKTPLMRLGTTEDVASAILFLSSPEASFITGQVLGVDGGFIG